MAPVAETVGLCLGGWQAFAATAQVAMEYDNLPKNIDDLDNALIPGVLSRAVSLLRSKREDLEKEIRKNKTKEPSKVCEQWIYWVRKTEKEAEKLLENDSDQIEKESSSFLSLPFSWGLDKEKEMKVIYQAVLQLLDQTKPATQTMLVDATPEPVVHMSTVDIKKYPTLQNHLEKIIDLLRKGKDKGIRIQGIVGIGKTTIMLNLNNHEEVAKIFDIVIWVTVSAEGKNLSMVDLQQQIMKRLKLKTESTGDACVLKEQIRLELRDRKYLLLLDDVKEDLNLHEIGIPDGKDGSTIVITTRKDHVCSKITKKVIKVTHLTEHESQNMFRDVLGKIEGIENREIVRTARRVCIQCYGIPLVIKQVANIFKLKKDPSAWTKGLDSWRYWPAIDKEGMRELYAMLKFSYYELDDDDRKNCFLYSALYPEDRDIRLDYLLKSWAAEDFLNNDHDPEKRHFMIKGSSILLHLKNVSLLEEGKNKNHVKVQKFMRQVALLILEEDDVKCKVLISIGPQDPHDVKSWTGMNMISLGNIKLDKLPKSPDCPMLSTLFLQRNLDLKEIPVLFFDKMKSLKVLDLSDTGIDLLPSSLSILINLKNLYLHNCENLVELTYALELRNLEVLDVQGSGINNVPSHIEKLICLRSLRVSFKVGNQNAIQEINYNTISKLSKLEELSIDVKSPQQWSKEVQEEVVKTVAALKEFKNLCICFPDGTENFIKVNDSSPVNGIELNADVHEDTMILCFVENNPLLDLSSTEFDIFIGCKDSKNQGSPKLDRYAKYIKYCNGTQVDFPNSKLLLESEAFELVNHCDIQQLSGTEVASMNRVRGCVISSCGAIENIVGTVNTEVLPELEHLYLEYLPRMKQIWIGLIPPGSFAKLETLVLEYLPRMKQIWTGLIPPGSFAKLEALVLAHCPMLVHVFPLGMIQQVCNIKCLKIEECEGVEEIILESDVNGNALPQLEKLVLVQMKNLKSICAIESLKWPSLKKLEIYRCEKLCKLPFTKDNAKELKFIKVEQQWWGSVKCQDKDTKEHLSQFCIYGS